MPILATYMVPHPPLIVPDVGHGEERIIKATVDSYEKISEEIAKLMPETIIVASPHSVCYTDYFHISPGTKAYGSFSRFGAGQVSFDVEYDEELVSAICTEAARAQISAGTRGERDPQLDHGTMVPLYFINKRYTNYKLVRTGLSGLSLHTHYAFGECIFHAVEKLKRRVVIIASGDLSHKLKADGPYGFSKEGPEYDEMIMEVMGNADFQKLFDFNENFCECAAECGHRSFVIMAGTLDGKEVFATRLSHEGPFGVGYGVCSYIVED